MARIVYIGLLFEGSSAAFRAESLRRLGHDVQAIEGCPAEPGILRIRGGLRRRFQLGPPHVINDAIVTAVREQAADVLWVDKGLNVSASTLMSARKARRDLISIHYCLDDYRIPGNTSRDLRQALSRYDLVVTTKSFNVQWLRDHGARRPLMSWQGYDESTHRPPESGEVDPSLDGRIVLVGAWERQRAEVAAALAEAGLPVSVLSQWTQWAAVAKRCSSLEWRRWEVYGRAYAVAIGSAAVALGVLRKTASDLHTQRSVEIPACGTALLAERTSEHQALFLEGAEAEFFGSVPECVTKARALLSDPVARLRIARAGRSRCQRDGYSWTERVKRILWEVGIESQSANKGATP